MDREALHKILSRNPFEAFELHLSNGEVYAVRHPENIILFKTRLIIGYPEVERVVHCALIHINSIEALQTV